MFITFITKPTQWTVWVRDQMVIHVKRKVETLGTFPLIGLAAIALQRLNAFLYYNTTCWTAWCHKGNFGCLRSRGCGIGRWGWRILASNNGALLPWVGFVYWYFPFHVTTALRNNHNELTWLETETIPVALWTSMLSVLLPVVTPPVRAVMTDKKLCKTPGTSHFRWHRR